MKLSSEIVHYLCGKHGINALDMLDIPGFKNYLPEKWLKDLPWMKILLSPTVLHAQRQNNTSNHSQNQQSETLNPVN